MPTFKIKKNNEWKCMLGTTTITDADTVDGKHASDFALVEDVNDLKILVGDKSVAIQIQEAIDSIPIADEVSF